VWEAALEAFQNDTAARGELAGEDSSQKDRVPGKSHFDYNFPAGANLDCKFDAIEQFSEGAGGFSPLNPWHQLRRLQARVLLRLRTEGPGLKPVFLSATYGTTEVVP
jgi:hypothetical protein